MTGEIAAGDRIGEVQLAKDLGVSRGPIREALRTLAQAGLIEIQMNRGAVARSIGLNEIKNLYALRGALFALACQEVARLHDSETVTLLKNNMAAARAALAQDDKDTYYRLNVEFHSAIVDHSGNPRAIEVYHAVVKEMHLFRRRGLSNVPNIAESVREHEAILAAIESGDPDAAREAGRIHIDGGRRRFLDTLNQDQPHQQDEADQKMV